MGFRKKFLVRNREEDGGKMICLETLNFGRHLAHVGEGIVRINPGVTDSYVETRRPSPPGTDCIARHFKKPNKSEPKQRNKSKPECKQRKS